MIRFLFRFGGLFAALTLAASPALAQQRVEIQYRNAAGVNVPVSADTPLPTAGGGGGASGLTDTQLRATAVPVSVSALPLPSGAATSALQTSGNTSLTTLTTGLLAQGSTTTGQVGQLGFCAALTSATARTTAQSVPLQCDTATGGLRVAISAGSVGLTAGTNYVGYVISAQVFTETTTAIGASATFTGTSRDAGATLGVTTFGCRANVNQVGTLVIEDSVDNTAWFRAASAATTVDPLVAVDLQVNLRARYHRCNFINGATATTVQRIVSSYRD